MIESGTSDEHWLGRIRLAARISLLLVLGLPLLVWMEQFPWPLQAYWTGWLVLAGLPLLGYTYLSVPHPQSPRAVSRLGEMMGVLALLLAAAVYQSSVRHEIVAAYLTIFALIQAGLITSAGKVRRWVEPLAARHPTTIFTWVLLGTLIVGFGALIMANLGREAPLSNEAAATSVLRALNTAEITFASTYNSGFSDGLHRLGPPPAGSRPDVNHAGLVDLVVAGLTPGGTDVSFVKGGYRFTYTPGPPSDSGMIGHYTIVARPVERGRDRDFFADESAIIRVTGEDRPATVKDRPI